jgi:hypothetical protein
MATRLSAESSPNHPAHDPLFAWRSGVQVRQVAPQAGRHTIHSYFNVCPESPDGRYVLYYASTTPEGYEGEIRVLERATGTETVLARGVHVEDAHRSACQQWAHGGKKAVFHDLRDGRWVVVAVDMETAGETILAFDRQLGFGSATEVWAPIIGCHWNPAGHNDLELVNVETGDIRTPVKIKQVAAECREWMSKEFGDREISIYAPVISPDGKRVFFKVAAASGNNDFQSPDASHREGKIVCDIESGRVLHQFTQWGHPSWHPDCKRIFEKGNILIDSQTGHSENCLPLTQSDHPSYSPMGDLFVTDGKVLSADNPKPGEWGIVVACPASNEYVIADRFDNSKGAKSWRKNHPHPVFSRDGRRIYFNVNKDEWTRLHVAEAAHG